MLEELPTLTTSEQKWRDDWEMNVELNQVHPHLDIKQRKDCDDMECESNMVVKVQYKGKTYRVDFEREGNDLMKLPRALKKIVALEDIQKTVDREEAEKEKEQRAEEELKKNAPAVANKMKQEGKMDSIRERLRMKLMKLNPVKYGKQV